MATSTSASEPTASFQSLKKLKFNPRILIGIGVLGVAGYFGWQHFAPKPAPNVLNVSGRIEADETDIGAKTGGRIIKINVREGDPVQVGQVVAVIQDEEVNEQLNAAIADVKAARQEADQARLGVNVAESRVQESQANLAQALQDSQGRVTQAESTMAANQAQVNQARAQAVQAQSEVQKAAAQLRQAIADRDRYVTLGKEGVIPQQQVEQAQTNTDTARASIETAKATLKAQMAAVNTAEKQLQAARGNLVQAQSTALNSTIRNRQLAAFEEQKKQAYAQLAAAQAKVQAAIAAQLQLQKRLDSFDIKSPINGTVQDRPLEPGAVVASGRTLLTVLNPQAVYLRAYIPEGDIGKIYTGQPAKVFLDSDPDRPLLAKVSAIDPKASFTPENIYFPKDRVKQVFGVKLVIEQSKNYAKPGMPASAEIDLNFSKP